MYSGETLVKIIRSDKCHNDFVYKTGLNILNKPFQPKGSCVSGGFYYTNMNNVHNYYSYGELIVIIKIPDDALVVQDSDKTCGEKWRTDKIILCEEYLLFDVETIKKFNLKITPDYLKYTSIHGHVNVLEWLFNSGLPLDYSEDPMDYASAHGHLDVLECWKNSKLRLKYSEKAIDHASMNGHPNVLEWWCKSGLGLKYSEKAMGLASMNNHINVLEWWKNSGLLLKYSEFALNSATMNGHLDVLKWWLNSGLSLKYDYNILMYNVCKNKNKQVNVLEWWKNSGLQFRYS
jgi:hypothetical protein